MAHVASKARFSLVIPVFKNESWISDLIERCEFLNRALSPIEFVFVVDGSPDNSLEFLRLGLTNTELRYKVINLKLRKLNLTHQHRFLERLLYLELINIQKLKNNKEQKTNILVV
jgi:hypothetical protein